MLTNFEWTRRRFFQAGCLGAAATFTAGSRIRAEEKSGGVAAGLPIDVGDRRQLFLDDYLIDTAQTQGFTRTMNPPRQIQRVLVPDQPWEALGFIFYCSVVDEGGEAKLYHGSYDAEKKRHFEVATSKDGLTWERPKLGLKGFNQDRQNNLLPLDAVEASVFIDPHSPPEKRYRLVLSRGWPDPETAGIYVASSPDGIQWNMVPERVFPFVPDSQHVAVWDEKLEKYVIYLRAWNDKKRMVCRVAVEDMEKPWPYDTSVPPYLVWGKDKIPTPSRELPTVMACDERDPENLQLYTSSILRYPYAQDAYIAFPAAYQLYKGADWQVRAVSTNDGTFDTQFASSRDGITWNRWREPYVGTGMQGDLELKLVSMGPGFVRRGPWLHQYFVGWPYTHGFPGTWDTKPETRAEWLGKDRGGIYCATQRVDGFVSMDAAYTGATLTTAPLVFKGTRLLLNLHTAGSGSAKVALLDESGKPLPGFALEDSELIQADHIDHEVQWKGGADVSALAERPVRVQITARNAKIYALQFSSAGVPKSA
jgi:hypothetical protein